MNSIIWVQQRKREYKDQLDKANQERVMQLQEQRRSEVKDLSNIASDVDHAVLIVGDGVHAMSENVPALDYSDSDIKETATVDFVPSSILYEPWTVENPTDLQRYDFGVRVSRWAQQTLPPVRFDPKTKTTISNVELKLIDAIRSLKTIAPAEDRFAEEENFEQNNPFRELMKGQLEKNGEEIAEHIVKNERLDDLFSEAGQLEIFEGVIFEQAFKSTVTSEGLKRSSELLIKGLEQQLDAYDAQRRKKFPNKPFDVTNLRAVPGHRGPELREAP
ncbi:hypothetical protein ACVIGB_000584 [Bradyrhizobium sp. USDA 4341]